MTCIKSISLNTWEDLGVYAEVQQVCIKDGSFSSFIHVERKMKFVCDQENISGIKDFVFQ